LSTPAWIFNRHVYFQILFGKNKSFKNPYVSGFITIATTASSSIILTETLVPCRFLVRAHPGHLHPDEAEEQLRSSLGLDPEELKFQLSRSTMPVPVV
jgi:hypothetical protein